MAGHPPLGRPATIPAARSPHRACKPRGQCWAPHTRTPAPTGLGGRTPTARPEGKQLGEGERLTSVAPHNGERHPPRGRPSATPRASNAGPQGRTLWRWCWVPAPAPTAPGTHGSRNPGCPPQRTRGRGEGQPLTPDAPHNGCRPPPPQGRPPTTPSARSPHRACKPRGQCWAPTPAHPRPQHVGSGPRQPAKRADNRGRGRAGPRTALTTKEGTRPGDALPPTPQRTTPVCKGARCGARAGSPRPHQPHPGHTDHRTPATRPRGWAAKGGTAPDTRRASQRGQATPPGMAPRHAAPTGHVSQGDSSGPPHVGSGPRQPAPRAGSQRRRRAGPQTPLTTAKGTPPGTPFRHPHSAQGRPARAHTVGLVPGPYARTNRTRGTRVAEPRLRDNAGPQGHTRWNPAGSPRPRQLHQGHAGR